MSQSNLQSRWIKSCDHLEEVPLNFPSVIFVRYF
jgi:hypothetical protein